MSHKSSKVSPTQSLDTRGQTAGTSPERQRQQSRGATEFRFKGSRAWRFPRMIGRLANRRKSRIQGWHAAYGQLAQHVHKEAFKRYQESVHSSRQRMALAVTLLIAYVLGGGACFHALEPDWTFADGVYFAVVTISTVGYGDINPTNTSSRWFTAFYGSFGIFVTFQEMIRYVAVMQDHASRQVSLFANKMGSRFGSMLEDATLTDRSGKCIPTVFSFLKEVWVTVVLCVAVQAASAGVYVAMADIDFGTACWHSWVSVATVGYGLVAADLPSTPQFRVWATFHIIFGTGVFAASIGRILSVAAKRKAELATSTLQKTPLTEELLDLLDKDGNGVDRMEYVIGMLTSLGKLDWVDVQPFLDKFDELDTDKSGVLTRDDMRKLIVIPPEAAPKVAGLGVLGGANHQFVFEGNSTKREDGANRVPSESEIVVHDVEVHQ